MRLSEEQTAALLELELRVRAAGQKELAVGEQIARCMSMAIPHRQVAQVAAMSPTSLLLKYGSRRREAV